MSRLLIQGGRVVDPATNTDGIRDVLIENGKIKEIGSSPSTSLGTRVKSLDTKRSRGTRDKGQGARRIEAEGMLVMPGLIDMHTHLRDPGRPDKETIASGSRAAALGGFTSIACMANTNPPIDDPALVAYIINKAKAEAVVNVFPIAAVTKGLKGEEIAEMGRCAAEGAVAFSDDGKPILRADVMRKALEYARQFVQPIIVHCEETALSAGGSMNESRTSTELGLTGIPALSEEVMLARDLLLAREFGRLHIAHLSSAESVYLVRQAKKRGILVTCETCPHYFSLTEEAVVGYDTNAKVNPPLKSKTDLKAVLRGLKDGTIDAIATDHAPHTEEEKKVEFALAANGMLGLETALALALTKLVNPKILTLKQLVEKMALNPSRILNLKNKGVLKVGADADVIIVDPKAEWTVDASKFASRSKNSPFIGWKLKGKILHTIVGGRMVVCDGKIC